VILLLAAKLGDVPRDRLREIKKASLECIEAGGGVNLSTLPTLWENVNKEGEP
jgi:hypothetical protein